MPNIASVFKTEIARVARKELKVETSALKAASSRARSDIAALKREVASLQKQLKRLTNGDRGRGGLTPTAAESEVTRHRFSAAGLASQRKRLGLSAEAMGKLIGVSALSVYHWEAGKSRPRDKYLPAIAALRTLGLKTAAAVLATR